MNSTFLKLTSYTFFGICLVLSSAPKISAASFKINGIFTQGGTLSGSFDFSNNSYSNVDILTQDTSNNLVASYMDMGNDGFLSGQNSTGFIISDPNFEFDLTIEFENSLSNTMETLLTVNSNEEDFLNGSMRFINSGQVVPVTTQIPESSSLGLIFTVGTIKLLRELFDQVI